METKQFIICRGIPGSGKSTWAKRWAAEDGEHRIRINNDDIRNMLGPYWVPKRERLVKYTTNIVLAYAMEGGYNIVVDNMNLNDVTIKELQKCVDNFNQNHTCNWSYEISFKDFFISLEEAITRDSLRPHPIGEKTIKDIYRRYRSIFNEEQINRPVLAQDLLLPHAIIVDLDGTLALNKSGRPYYGKEADEKYLLDTCVESVSDLVANISCAPKYGPNVIIMSGREGTLLGRKNTEKWLVDNGIIYDKLLMRKEKDYRPDEIVKRELFDMHIRGKYYVDCVIDDRDKVVKMWRELGLLCLQPWEGKF